MLLLWAVCCAGRVCVAHRRSEVVRRQLTRSERDHENARQRERARGIGKQESSRCSREQLINQQMIDAIRAILGLDPLYAPQASANCSHEVNAPDALGSRTRGVFERFKMAIPLAETQSATPLPVRRLRSGKAAMSEAIGRQVARARAGVNS